MKKIVIAFSAVFLVSFMIFLFSGCTSNNYNNLISDIRYGVFDAECEEYSVTFTYGLREKPYSPDGIVNEKVEFGIISVLFTGSINSKETVYYSIKINDNVTSGTLEKSPYTNQYMADIGKLCSDTDTISIEVYIGEATDITAVALKNKSADWKIDHEKALSKGIDALSAEINTLTKNKFTYEIQVKILNEQETNFGVYFWSFTLLSSDGGRYNVVFDIETGDILLKN